MPITFPGFFEQLLQRDRALRSGVDALTHAFDDLLSISKLPFFTDYTDHGVDHVNCVLATAYHLMTDDARREFTPGDAAVLIWATLLHDSALHLSESGFYQLIRGDASSWVIPHFGDRAWGVLWDEFLFSAKRWDERQSMRIFGEGLSGLLRSNVGDPFDHYDDLTDTDKRLIGEFIRRHHARMAHEFAVHGIPGRGRISLDRMLNPDLRDIAGLVARSHGLPVRAGLDYLTTMQYNRREYAGVHAPYLMVLLRVSDHLQIHAERAPAIAFTYRHIPSKLSRLEWSAHNAITNVTRTNDDRESIEIQARPDNVVTYLRLKEWLAGIQDELDASWAVLGEVYGSHATLSRLGLILRRVRSNLDDTQAFSAHVPYVPERIELSVARPDLLKLLVGPLYDNAPSIGIRELLQNAIDAVRERAYLQERHPELQHVTLIDQANDVEIRLGEPEADGRVLLTISDRGVGMTVETIRDYFLTAGASFRNSDAWKREFEQDDAPHSKVLRSGRFGVGILAGFLLGPRMEIETRHIQSDRGVRFSTALDLEPIELRYDATLRVGTSIKIRISREVYENLIRSTKRVSSPEAFDWFIYDHPRVARILGDPPTTLNPRHAVSRPDDPASRFRRLPGCDAYAVYWTYERLPWLTVNGLFVSDAAKVTSFASSGRQFHSESAFSCHIRHPHVCVEDADGAFPLNLRRTGITEPHYPFEADLRADIADDFLAYLLVHCPSRPSAGQWSRIPSHPGIGFGCSEHVEYFGININCLASTRHGLFLLPLRPTSRLKDQPVRFLLPPTRLGDTDWHGDGDSALVACSLYGRSNTWIGWAAQDMHDQLLTALSFALALRERGKTRSTMAGWLGGGSGVSGTRLLLPSSTAKYIADPEQWVRDASEAAPKHEKQEPEKVTQAIRAATNGIAVERSVGDYLVVASADAPDRRFLIPEGVIEQGRDVCLVEAYPNAGDPPALRGDLELLAARWREVIGEPVIPFDPDTRRRVLRHAYERLAPHIAVHEAMKSDGVLF